MKLSISVQWIHKPRHTPGSIAGLEGAFTETLPCYEYPGTPPAIRWDALLMFYVSGLTLGQASTGRYWLMQDLRVTDVVYDSAGSECEVVEFYIVEVFRVGSDGRAGPDPHTSGRRWSLECESDVVKETAVHKGCRITSEVVASLQLCEAGRSYRDPGNGEKYARLSSSATSKEHKFNSTVLGDYMQPVAQCPTAGYSYIAEVEHCNDRSKLKLEHTGRDIPANLIYSRGLGGGSGVSLADWFTRRGVGLSHVARSSMRRRWTPPTTATQVAFHRMPATFFALVSQRRRFANGRALTSAGSHPVRPWRDES